MKPVPRVVWMLENSQHMTTMFIHFFASNSKIDYGNDCETERKSLSQALPLHIF